MSWKRRDTSRLIEDPATRQVAFSKRRPSLFAMAGHLSALCGADTAVVVFSPSARGNAHAFGSPSVDAVLQRLDSQDGEPGALAVVEEEHGGAAALEAKRRELDETRAKVADEKARVKAVEEGVERAMAATPTARWWEADVNVLGGAELPEFETALWELRDAVLRHVDALSQQELPSGQ
ncbi:unnamed protein product [Alopecurus aequalis]